MHLSRMGWNDSLENAFAEEVTGTRVPARIAREERGLYLAWTERGDLPAQVTGRFRDRAAHRGAFPAVGDWVSLEPVQDGRARIHRVLPRTSCFRRKVVGGLTEEQVLAANVDTVFLVAGLDHDFNVRRLERYLTLAWDSGADPVILLNKADLSDRTNQCVLEAREIACGQPVLPVSAVEGHGMDAVLDCLGPGRTGAFLGSSGVGKSTLINRLLGEDRLETQPVREGDSKGRHTTTRRELFLLPVDHGLVIDTPGMREIQLWASEDSARSVFSEVEELAAMCRFRDCSHRSEPDCAVRDAIERGALEATRLESFRKQCRELARLERRRDGRLQHQQRMARRKVARIYRAAKKAGRGKKW